MGTISPWDLWNSDLYSSGGNQTYPTLLWLLFPQLDFSNEKRYSEGFRENEAHDVVISLRFQEDCILCPCFWLLHEQTLLWNINWRKRRTAWIFCLPIICRFRETLMCLFILEKSIIDHKSQNSEYHWVKLKFEYWWTIYIEPIHLASGIVACLVRLCEGMEIKPRLLPMQWKSSNSPKQVGDFFD